MRFRKLTSTVAALALSAAIAAPADAAIIYTLSGLSNVIVPDGAPPAPQSFSVTLDDYLTTDTFVPASALTSCASADGAACEGFQFSVDDPTGNGFDDYSLIDFKTETSGTFYYFDKAVFTAPGVYDNSYVGFNRATLTVVNTGAPGVPAPALGFGLLPALLGGGTLGLTRLRKASRKSAAA